MDLETYRHRREMRHVNGYWTSCQRAPFLHFRASNPILRLWQQVGPRATATGKVYTNTYNCTKFAHKIARIYQQTQRAVKSGVERKGHIHRQLRNYLGRKKNEQNLDRCGDMKFLEEDKRKTNICLERQENRP